MSKSTIVVSNSYFTVILAYKNHLEKEIIPLDGPQQINRNTIVESYNGT